MAGPVSSIAYVPLSELLPAGFGRAEQRLRDLARRLEAHPAAERMAWFWHPEHVDPPAALAEDLRQVLLWAAITLYNTRDDWLELSLSISWRDAGQLTAYAAVEVACWCAENHNMHPVRDLDRDVDDDLDLGDAFAAGVKMLTTVLDEGPFEPQPWRQAAGLELRPG
jgi:hypothetical protein